MFPLVEAALLKDRLEAKSPEEQADLALIDVRWYLRPPSAAAEVRSGKSEYAAGHLPTAVFVDLETALAGDPASGANGGPGRHPLPSAQAFEQAMRDAGVNHDTLVVAYDDAGGSTAARLWWLLRYFGHDQVAVLDGGIEAWKKVGGALKVDAPRITPGNFHARNGRKEDVLDHRAVSRALTKGALLIDARSRDRYRGDSEPIDARAGHIPGAANAPWSENLSKGKFLSKESLAEKYRTLGANGARDVIVYCGSGVTACHDLLALELAGIRGSKLYEGSWSDWAAHKDLPLATGDDS